MKKEVKQRLAKLIEKAKLKTNSSEVVNIGKVTKTQADLFQKKLGIDVRGFDRYITSDGVRHALKHTNISAVDILSIDYIVDSPDIVGIGKKESTLVYKKKIVDYMYYVECIHSRRKELRIITMYKRKAT